MGAGNLVTAGIVALILLWVGRPLLYLFALLKSQFRLPTFQVIAAADLADDVRACLEQGAQPLIELGFAPLGFVRAQTFEHSQHGDLPSLVLLHDATGARATVTVSAVGNALRTNFRAELDDGSRLETMHGESKMLIGVYPRTEVVDCSSPDVRDLWRVFSERLALACQTRTVVRHDLEQHARATSAWYERLIASWLADGTLQRAREAERYELTFRRAWYWAWRMTPAMAAHAKFTLAQAKLRPIVIPVSEQIRGYQQLRELSTRRSTRWRWTSFLAVSAVVFAVSMLRIVEPRDVLALVVVVILHELGHYAAMRLLGYKDTSIFFIPFLGAATRGAKNDERAHEQLAVLLAGPMPGIILGVALPWIAPQLAGVPAFKSFTDLLVFINAFNLLPIFPLDGGRIVQVLFGTLPPFVEVGFKALSALALLALGVFAGDSMLIAFSVVLLVAMRSTKRAADAVKRIRALGPVPASEDARLGLVFDELVRNQPSLPPRARPAVAMPVADRLRQAPLGALGVGAWSSMYLGCVVAGVVAVAVSTLGTHAFKRHKVARRSLPCDRIAALAQHGRGSYSLECSLSDRAKVRELQAAFEDFERLPHASCLRAPWEATPLSGAEARARHTVAALAREQSRALRAEYERFASSQRDRRVDAEAVASYRASARAVPKRVYEAMIRAHVADVAFDGEAAALYMQETITHDADDELDESAATADADARLAQPCSALVAKLGGVGEGCLSNRIHNLSHARMDDDALVVTGFDDQLEVTLPLVARYMCAAGCDLRYSASTR